MNARPDPSAPAVSSGRMVDCALRFARSGDRTYLAEQRSPHPFHITRPFRLDPALPHLATLYLQSSAGGIYRDDALGLSIAADRGAAVHVTTQAATIVHDTKGLPARQTTRLIAADGAFLAYTPDPAVLFSNAALVSHTELRVAPDAQAILGEAYAWHDPAQTARPFERLSAEVEIRSLDGALLAADRGALSGADWIGPVSPMGRYRAFGALFVVGAGSDGFDPAAVDERLAGLGCLVGVSPLPNGAGRMLRLLAGDGGTLGRALDVAFQFAFERMLGVKPERRRK